MVNPSLCGFNDVNVTRDTVYIDAVYGPVVTFHAFVTNGPYGSFVVLRSASGRIVVARPVHTGGMLCVN